MRDHQASSIQDARAALAQLPGDGEAHLRLSIALFSAADVVFSGALVDWGEQAGAGDVAELIDGDAQLSDAVRGVVARYCAEGLQHAERALEVTAAIPDSELHLGARLLVSLNLSMLCWSEGGVAALFGGRVGRLTTAMAALVSDAPEFALGAPLRLRGRFLTRAPWPLGDIDEARALLQRACDLSPVPINHLFLGDVLLLDGDEAAARLQWQAALTAEPDEGTALCAPLQRRMSEQRLQL